MRAGKLRNQSAGTVGCLLESLKTPFESPQDMVEDIGGPWS